MAYETLTIAIAALAATGIVTLAALRGWQGWLALKLREIDRAARPAPAHQTTLHTAHRTEFRDDADVAPAARIELADLKERVRQLEAIAAGVDL